MTTAELLRKTADVIDHSIPFFLTASDVRIVNGEAEVRLTGDGEVDALMAHGATWHHWPGTDADDTDRPPDRLKATIGGVKFWAVEGMPRAAVHD